MKQSHFEGTDPSRNGKRSEMKGPVDLYYLTGTGNTLLVARAMEKVFRDKGLKCTVNDLCKIDGAEVPVADRTLGILYPVHAYSVPKIVLRFLKDMPRSDDAEFFVLANCHSRPGTTMRKVYGALLSKGFNPLGMDHTITPTNCIILQETEDEETAEKMRGEAVNRAVEFAGHLLDGKAKLDAGGITTFQILVKTVFGIRLPNAVKNFTADVNCNSCGECAEMCPVGNITMRGERPFWGNKCEICLRCVNYCPQGAIQLMSSSGKRRYKEPSFDPLKG